MITPTKPGTHESHLNNDYTALQDKTTAKTDLLSHSCFAQIAKNLARGVGIVLIASVVVLAVKATLPIWATVVLAVAAIALPYLAFKAYESIERRISINALMKEIEQGGDEKLKKASNFLDNKDLLTVENLSNLIDNPEHAGELAKGFSILNPGYVWEDTKSYDGYYVKQPNLLTAENREILLDCPEHAEQLARGLDCLHSSKGKLTTETREILLDCPEHALSLAKGICAFDWHHAPPPPLEILKILIKSPQNALILSKELYSLKIHDFVTKESVKALLVSPENSKGLGQALVHLNNAGILTRETCKALTQDPESTVHLAKIIFNLHSANILNRTTYKALMESPVNAQSISSVTSALTPYDAIILTTDNFYRALESPDKTESVAKAFHTLCDNSYRASQKDFDAFFENPDKSESLAKAFKLFYRFEKSMKGETPEHIHDFLAQNPTYAESLAKNPMHAKSLEEGLNTLSTYQRHFITQKECEILIKFPENAKHLAESMNRLSGANLLSEKNLEELIRGNGAHAKFLIDYMKPNSRLTQKLFDKIMEIPSDQARLAVTTLAMHNRSPLLISEGKTLPSQIVELIANYVAPDYSRDPTPKAPLDLSERINQVQNREWVSSN